VTPSTDESKTTMKSSLVPLLCLGGAYALPALPWLSQFPVEGLVRYWDWFTPLEEDKTIYQVLKDDDRSCTLVVAFIPFD